MVCKGKQRCPNCGGDPRVEECKDNGQEKCCNCGGQHRVTYGGCEVRKRAVEIEQEKAVNNVSYAEAVKRVQVRKGKDVTDKVSQSLRSEVDQTEKSNTALTGDKLILFIAYVINCDDQAKNKTKNNCEGS